MSCTTVYQEKDVSGELELGNAYNLLYAQRVKECETRPTDISIPTGSTLAGI
jgi:hypothetical protein